MVDKPSLPNLPGLKPKPEHPIVNPDPVLPGFGKPEVNPLTGKAVVNPLHPPDVEAAQAAFDASVIALEEATGGRNVTSIPLSDGYWGAVHTHNVAYTALKDALREIPISSPPDSDILHDIRAGIESIKRGEPESTTFGTVLARGISVPVENVPEEFQPFQRAQIPLGTKLVTAVEQPMEEAVIELPIPTPTP
jgi:hypothetical protein